MCFSHRQSTSQFRILDFLFFEIKSVGCWNRCFQSKLLSKVSFESKRLFEVFNQTLIKKKPKKMLEMYYIRKS